MNLNVKGLWGNRLPIVHQTSIAECGLASIVMVLGYHGYETDIQTLRSRFATSIRGMNLGDIKNVAEQLGLSTRAVRINNLDACINLKAPCILHWEEKHFVVLKKYGARKVVIHDPGLGVMKITHQEFQQRFSGIAMEFTPSLNFKRIKERAQFKVRDLFKDLTGLKKSIVYIISISLALELFANLIPLYTQWIVDKVLVSSDYSLLKVLLVGYLAIVCFQACASIIRAWILMRFGMVVNAHFQARVFNHLIRLPTNYFEQRHIGDITSRFNSLHLIQSTLTNSFIEVFLDAFMGIIICIIMFSYSPRLSLIALSFVLVYATLRWARYLPFKMATHEQVIAEANLGSHFYETVRGIRGIQLFNRHLVRKDQWQKKLFSLFNKNLALGYLNINYGELGSLIGYIEKGVVLYFGATLVMDGGMSVGFLLAFIAYKDQFVSRVDRLIERTVDLGMVKVQIDRLNDILMTEAEGVEDLPYLIPQDIESSISMSNLSYRYSVHENWVVKDFNMDVAVGEHVAITGRSGCGKSTIAKLLLGILKAEEGEISVGGVPLNKLGTTARNYISCVMQDDELYSGTILENISFFDTEPDLLWAQECAKIAELDTEICFMKMGYNTIIGEIGSSLSGGQKQRLLIARALYTRPRILVLDESTSDLDIELEQKISRNIQNLEMTRISIAHRPQTIAAADRAIHLS